MYCFTLIKKGQVRTNKKIIPAAEFTLAMSAHEILEEAKKEREELLEKTKSECETIKKEAYEKGFQEGLIALNSQILFFDEKIKILRHEMQKAILPLVLKATRRIIGESLEIKPDLIVDIVMQAIKSVASSRFIKLYVNRQDVEILEEAKERMKQVFESVESFEIEDRADIPRGSCMIETERGILNATLENQFRALERAFETHKHK